MPEPLRNLGDLVRQDGEHALWIGECIQMLHSHPRREQAAPSDALCGVAIEGCDIGCLVENRNR
ncbi:MAG TPA: hypothetical protein PKC43_01560 [Phycisphaerales bacterium]|nr:hypothetical protein [Phycisphaerales bacterium]HMP36112.1 hypothetical protein [Phycisphaerales bacterium]